jgi:hypothetical protein
MVDKEVALYDLSKMPATYDFAAYAVIAKTRGVKHIRFVYEGVIQTKKFSQSTAWKRFANILIPICHISGLTYSVGPRVSGFTYGYSYGEVNRLFEERGVIEKLKPTFDHGGRDYITVTLRESIRNTYRDSNKEAWAEFAESLGKQVYILPDVETSPMGIDLEYRMSLYSYADMNLGASNGPMALCHFSDAPYLTFNMIPEKPEAESLKQHMIKDGFFERQFSFANEKQKLVWKPDTLETINWEYEEMFPRVRILGARG